MNRIDIAQEVGRKFGKWTVLADAEGKRHRMIKCRCECGNVRVVCRDNVVSGKSTGCRACSGRAGKNNPRWSGYGDIPGNLWGILQKSAAARDIEVLVSIADLQELWEAQDGKCALTGLPLVLASKTNGLTASVDRIDSDVGYVRGNIQFVHKNVNLMKNRFDQTYFIEICRLVSQRAAA
mgnify:FL=1